MGARVGKESDGTQEGLETSPLTDHEDECKHK